MAYVGKHPAFGQGVTNPGNAMITIDILIWQFVRIMVFLEQIRDGDGAHLYALWKDQWQAVDRKLSELADKDPDGFARMMMEETVALHCTAPAQLDAMMQAVDGVVAELKSEIAKGGDDEHLTDLAFERDELTAMKKDLANVRSAIGPDDGDDEPPPSRRRRR